MIAEASVKTKTVGVPPSVQEKGRENTMDTQEKKERPRHKKGFQVFKTIAALRLASRKEGVSTREMGEKLNLSHTACYGTLEALVEAGEAVKDKKRYYSDVFSTDEPNPLVRREPSTKDGIKEKIQEIIFEVQKKYFEMYPIEVFGQRGTFINKIIVSATMDIYSKVEKFD